LFFVHVSVLTCILSSACLQFTFHPMLFCSTMQLLTCTLCCVCNWPYSC
jgi:hypothetical protein